MTSREIGRGKVDTASTEKCFYERKEKNRIVAGGNMRQGSISFKMGNTLACSPREGLRKEKAMKQERQYKRRSEAAGQAGGNGHRCTASSQLDFMRDHGLFTRVFPGSCTKTSP